MVKFTANILKLTKIQISDCTKDIQDFIQSIENNSKIYDINIFKFSSDNNIVIISFNLKLELPLRRSTMEIKINEIEPVFLMISYDEFPYRAPLIFSDRIDFPVTKLPHIIRMWRIFYGICIHRGNLNDWYIEHTPNDFINRIYSWYKDAATGNLIKKGDEFEPMMISEDSGIVVYSYNIVTAFIENYWRKNNGSSGIGFFVYNYNNAQESKLLDIDDNSSIQIKNIYEKGKIHQLIKELSMFRTNHIGILTWCKKDEVYDKYIEYMPKDLNELYKICEKLDNAFKRALNILKHKNINKNQSALIAAINRPTKLIRYDKNIELFNFIFKIEKINQNGIETINPEGKVFTLRHLEPITKDLAAEISNQDINFLDKKIITIGAGALGSKIILYLSKNGYINNTIVDNDTLAPHNLIRHVLFADSVGKKKSTEIVSKLNEIYYLDSTKNFKSSEDSFFQFSATNNLDEYDILIDFSACKSVKSFLSDYKKQLPKIVISGELANSGKLGLLILEGYNRKPKIDEIQIMLFKLALENVEISEWLMRYKNIRETHGEAEFEDILVGLGCSTNTMKLSDEIISYHSAIFANYIKKIIRSSINNAVVMISHFNEMDYCKNYCKIVPIKQFINVPCDNNEWSIKLYSTTYENIKLELDRSNPYETGGILIGHIDLIKKIIYIVDIFIPEDSKEMLCLFTKGSKGTWEYIENTINKTGGMLTYVGDWHTHPNHDIDMSPKDKSSLNELKLNLKDTAWPAHIIIFNNTNYKSYILCN